MESCDLNDVMKEIGEIKGTLTVFAENTNKLLEKHDGAIDNLQAAENQRVGKATLAGSIAGVVFGLIGSLMQSGFFHK